MTAPWDAINSHKNRYFMPGSCFQKPKDNKIIHRWIGVKNEKEVGFKRPKTGIPEVSIFR